MRHFTIAFVLLGPAIVFPKYPHIFGIAVMGSIAWVAWQFAPAVKRFIREYL